MANPAFWESPSSLPRCSKRTILPGAKLNSTSAGGRSVGEAKLAEMGEIRKEKRISQKACMLRFMLTTACCIY